ncbi:toll/interleukin-1 receptor domain-containing protein [Nostoc sp. ChiQUE01b]|uniref:toll/interleukin-1 receptor domain-containing protein n=1 Tax=Nostoc sp. ChiQUE01b TaxID=3075376 RepID=UPI002AD225B0|nr:toll/interleukin-1 receptor domain-containing protein [Nostoc sp. ChiQUE01b]MDZ8264407.1 toll/interleukin-1 receptor domain-containing protein [Nostoc sp. ChiQUE01b]
MNNLLEFDVFLAHNSLDKVFVREIAKKLRRGRLKPWLDEDAILPGQIIQEEIQRIILHIKSTIIFIGKNGLGRWQKVELRTLYTQCIERGILVIPVLLPGVSDFPQELLFLKEHKWIHFINSINDEKAIQELKLAIRQTKENQKLNKSNNQSKLLKPPLKKTKSQQENLKPSKKPNTHLDPSPDIATSKSKTTNIIPSVKPTNVKLSSTRIAKINESNPASNRRKAKSTSTIRASKNKATTINNSGAWVLLNNNLFKTELVETQTDQSIVLNIVSTDTEKEAILRRLQPENYNKKQITYVYQNDADIMHIESVLVKSVKGKNRFTLTLKPYFQGQIDSFTEININGFSADKIAELRARLILLNESSILTKTNQKHCTLNYCIQGYNNSLKIEKCIFLDLWRSLNKKIQVFLIHARLLAIYYLKMTFTVEHILELKLTLINNNMLSVQFRGQRKQFYANQEPALIEVKGNCLLNI